MVDRLINGPSWNLKSNDEDANGWMLWHRFTNVIKLLRRARAGTLLQKIAARSMKKPFRLFLHQIWKTQQIKLRMEHMAQPRFQPIDILPGQDSGIAIRPFRGFP